MAKLNCGENGLILDMEIFNGGEELLIYLDLIMCVIMM